MTMIDDSLSSNDAPPPYRSVLSSEVNLSHIRSPSQTSSSSRESERPPEARRQEAAPSRSTPTSGLSRTARRRTATDVGHAAPLARDHSAKVRRTTQKLLRDLLSQPCPSEREWLSLLSDCADTCNAQDLNFSALLQEPFVEDHLPVYWAILKNPPAAKTDRSSSASKSKPDALVHAILDASLPINAASIADARLACAIVSDNALFVRLGQRYKVFLPRSGTDRVLLGGTKPVDTIKVKEVNGSDSNVSAAFTLRFSITQFQLRMRVSEQARIEFIARGRFWYLAFSVAGPNTRPFTIRAGEWVVSLGLAEHSSPTWVDGKLYIERPSLPPKNPTSDNDCNEAWLLPLPIKTTSSQLSPKREIVVSLNEVSFGCNLQNDATSIVNANGTLKAVLKVKLRRPNSSNTGCIIC